MINITSIYNRCRIQRMLLVAGLGWQSVCTAARPLKKKGKCWGDPELESWGYSSPDSRGFSNLDTPISKRFYRYLWLDDRELLASAVCCYGSLLSHRPIPFQKVGPLLDTGRSEWHFPQVWVNLVEMVFPEEAAFLRGFSSSKSSPPLAPEHSKYPHFLYCPWW